MGAMSPNKRRPTQRSFLKPEPLVLDDGTRPDAPLAARMRPRSLDEFVGQEHIVGPERALRRAIESDHVPSMILWGPPGAGKTTLARIVAATTKSHFDALSAVSASVSDLRSVAVEARDRRDLGMRSILFVDEIHRFNKAQQDVILPFVEDGTVTLIGATTENPSFEVISPLLSRARVYTLNALADQDIEAIVRSAVVESERGLGTIPLDIDDAAIDAIVHFANGDARAALNALEGVANAARPAADGRLAVTAELVSEVAQRSLRYDKAGEGHYDTISAFIKSVRGSDPDATVYWLARMIESGEDPLFIVRRMVVLAAEDVGLADPQGLVVAMAAQQAVHFIGLPEGYLPMAEAAIYLAMAPKSNSAYRAYNAAIKDVEQTRADPVPLHLRNAVTGLMRRMGYGRDYKYAHDYEGHFVEQEHLPANLKGHRYYEPTDEGFEEQFRRLLDQRRGQAS
jgi:putative ATPase